MASVVRLFKRPSDGKEHEWTQIAIKLLDKASHKLSVFAAYARAMHPMEWSGARSAKLEQRLKLLKRLPIARWPELTEAYNKALVDLESEIQKEQENEKQRSRKTDATFED
jgi:hypothetical protein